MMTAIDPWMPVGTRVADATIAKVIAADDAWQLYATSEPGKRCLVALPALGQRWEECGLLPKGALVEVVFGAQRFFGLTSGPAHILSAIEMCDAPRSFAEAIAFATALARKRSSVPDVSVGDGVYVERYLVLLPSSDLTPPMADDVVLGRFLTGGVPVSVRSGRRLATLASWMAPEEFQQVCVTAGVGGAEGAGWDGTSDDPSVSPEGFLLPGRPDLEAFFREHVLHVLAAPERYAALGVTFPGAIVLHGPPGTGKTYAVERLVEHLQWPNFEISSGSVGSPFIHETGRKVAEVFDRATNVAPAVVVIDEMEAFLGDRDAAGAGGGHRVEEVAEFLRRIPEAAENRVLVIAMTNRIEAVDPAILRRGRFDHLIEVGYATVGEIEGMLRAKLSQLPCAPDVNPASLAAQLAGRPLADVAFVIRDAGRRAARAGLAAIDLASLLAAAAAAPGREPGSGPSREIGFGR